MQSQASAAGDNFAWNEQGTNFTPTLIQVSSTKKTKIITYQKNLRGNESTCGRGGLVYNNMELKIFPSENKSLFSNTGGVLYKGL